MKKSKNVLLVSIVLVALMMVLSYIFKPVIFGEYNDIQHETIGYIDKDTIITQKFKSQFEILDTVSVQFANYNKEVTKGTLKTEIYDSNNTLIYLNKIELKELADNSEIRFFFDPQYDAKDKEYTIKFYINNLNKNESFTFYSGTSDNVFKSEKKISAEGVISIHQYGQRKSYFHTFLLLIVLLILTFVYFIIEYKNKKIKLNRFNNLLILIASFINAGLLLLIETSLFYNNKLPFLYLILFVVLSTVLLRNIVISCYSKRIELLFLSLAIPIGAMYLLYMIPGEVPDELFHLNQVLKIFDGNLFFNKVNNYQINTRVNSYIKLFNALLNKTTISFTNIGFTSGYISFLYLPCAIGMFFAKIINLNIMWQLYAASFGSFVVYLIVGYYIIKNIPFGKYITLVYLLNPMLLQQATSISCDAMINIMCIFFISYVLKLKYQKEDITYKDGILLSISAFYVLISKQAYFPILFILPLLRNKLKSSNKKSLALPLGITAVVFVIVFAVFRASSIPGTDGIGNIIDGVLVPQSNISELKYVLSTPLNLIYIFFNTLYYNLDFYIMSFAGSSLGALNISIPFYITIIYLIILFISCFVYDSEHEMKIIDRIVFIIAFVITFGIILAGLYLGDGTRRDFLVLGVQGRYFIPCLILILLCLYRPKVSLKIKNYSFTLAITLVFVNIVSLLYIMSHFLR